MHFVKAGLISKELGRAVNKAFDLRLRGDYREQTILTGEQVGPYLNQARNFINAVRDFLEDSGRI